MSAGAFYSLKEKGALNIFEITSKITKRHSHLKNDINTMLV
jgi:hypothetical protein